MEDDSDRDIDTVPLSESSVSHKLAEIQRRCSELLSEPDALTELSLEDPGAEVDTNNPYNSA